MTFRLLAAGLALFVAPAALHAKTGAWVTHGPYGGIVQSLLVDPATPTTLYAASTISGVFKSLNRGQSWAAATDGLTDPTVATLVMEPGNPETLYAAGGNGVFRTTDGGDKWQQISGLVDVTQLAIDPAATSIIYAVTSDDGLEKSTDSGATWTSLYGQVPAVATYCVVIDPQKPNIVYVVTYGGLYKSTNSGKSFTLITEGLAQSGNTPLVVNLWIDPKTPSTLYASTGLGFETSTDGGLKWSVVTTVPVPSSFQFLGLDPQQPTTLYGLDYPSVLYTSTNSGASWSKIAPLTPSYAGYTQIIVVDPTNSANLYAGTDAGVFASATQGSAWTQVNDGLANTAVTTVAIDPANQAILYAGTQSSGIFKSTDAGNSWSLLFPDYSGRPTNLVISPKTPTTLYYADSFHEGVFGSTNGGASFTNLLPYTIITNLAIDSSKPATLYAAGGADGVYKTTNGGVSWVAANAGLPGGLTPSSISVAKNTVLLTDPQQGVFLSNNGGARWTANDPPEPQSAQASARVHENVVVNNVAYGLLLFADGLNPRSADVVISVATYLDAVGYILKHSPIGGMTRTPNAAASWSPLPTPAGANPTDCPPLGAAAVDPVNVGTFYLGGLCGVLQGTSDGAQLTAINKGLPANVAVDALAVTQSGKTIYAGLFGRGVYAYRP